MASHVLTQPRGAAYNSVCQLFHYCLNLLCIYPRLSHWIGFILAGGKVKVTINRNPCTCVRVMCVEGVGHATRVHYRGPLDGQGCLCGLHMWVGERRTQVHTHVQDQRAVLSKIKSVTQIFRFNSKLLNSPPFTPDSIAKIHNSLSFQFQLPPPPYLVVFVCYASGPYWRIELRLVLGLKGRTNISGVTQYYTFFFFFQEFRS